MKTINQLALEVIDGKWGSGNERKKELVKAGYDYDAVQSRVNEIVKARKIIVDKMNAWGRKICADNRYHYNMWEQNDPQSHKCPICSKLKYEDNPDDFGWNCIGLTAAIWHHGGLLGNICKCGWISAPHGNADKLLTLPYDEALALARKCMGINDIELIRDINGIPKDKWNAGDICLKFDGKVCEHFFYYTGEKTIIDSTRIYSDKSKWTPSVIANQIKERSWNNYSAKVIIRYTGWLKKEKKTYTGKLPTLKLIKTNAEVIADAIKFALWIAGDNSFHYGYTDKHGSKDSKKWKPNAHHNGCFFCGTNTDKGGRSKAGIVDYKKTYCCNPFVTAAWAHGGCVPAALKLCRLGSSWTFSKGKGYDASKLFDNLGKIAKKSLKKGYVLCSDTHVALYIGDNKIVEAAHGDDNKRNSEDWNSSIRVATLTDSRYNSFKRVHRFNGSVNTTAYIGFGEVSDRVALLQSFLKWYGCDIASDRYFGEATLKAVKKFQSENGLEVDGKVGEKTLKKMQTVRK